MDVGPFEDVSAAIERGLEGWLLTDGMAAWVLSDRFGARFTLCPACMDGPLWDALRKIERRMRAKDLTRNDHAREGG